MGCLKIGLILTFASLLAGCPTKDWIKRDDAYVSVEQYKSVTEIVRINDRLYRVKKGEEINQNQITQIFYDLQIYKNASKKEREQKLIENKALFEDEPTIFYGLSYVLRTLESENNEIKAKKILSELDYSQVNANDKNLLNLAYLLQGLLQQNEDLLNGKAQLQEKIASMHKDYELVQEEVSYLNKQVNALKSIEESIHAREVGMELESR